MAEKSLSGTNTTTSSAPRRGLLSRVTAVLASAAMIAGALNFVTPLDASAAVTFTGFTKLSTSQLWVFNASTGTGSSVYGIDHPELLSAMPTTWPLRIQPNSGTNPCTVGSDQRTGAMGPVFISSGDTKLYMALWDGSSRTAGICLIDENGVATNVTTTNASWGTNTSALWGGEINQTTGELYIKRGSATSSIDGDGLSTNTPFTILSIATDLSVTPLATSTGIKPKAGAQNLSQAATAAGIPTSGGTTSMPNLTQSNRDGAWEVASDMAIDARGDIFLVVQNGTYHAIVKINVPRVAGVPQSGEWEYEVVKWIGNGRTTPGTAAPILQTGDIYASAFLEGDFYMAYTNRAIYRFGALTGAVESLGQVPADHYYDGATAQVAPVVSGTVYHDVEGDGSIAGNAGVGGILIEVWGHNRAGLMTMLGTTTTVADGSYNVVLPFASGEVYLRIKEPVIGSGATAVNAKQTYASAGVFQAAYGTQKNTVIPLCLTAGVDYTETDTSALGICNGARADGIDPSSISNATVSGDITVIAAAGVAAIVTK